MIPKPDDVVFCRVKKIEGTTVFLEVEGCEIEGSMVLSEVAAGRIRNLRQYVSPDRRVVCKVLKVNSDHVELSLRRVTTKEREQVMEGHKREIALSHVLRVVGEDPGKVIPKIKKDHDIYDFVESVRENPAALEPYVSKANVQKIMETLAEKEGRERKVEKKFTLQSFSESGVKDVKEILDVDAEVHYLGSSKFSIAVSAKDFKDANHKIEDALKEIEKRAKAKKAVFEMTKEKGK